MPVCKYACTCVQVCKYGSMLACTHICTVLQVSVRACWGANVRVCISYFPRQTKIYIYIYILQIWRDIYVTIEQSGDFLNVLSRFTSTQRRSH